MSFNLGRITMNIKFVYEGVLYLDGLGVLPRHEALKIPELKVEQNQGKAAQHKRVQEPSRQPATKPSKQKKYQQFQQQINEDNQQIEMDIEDPDNQIQAEDVELDEQDQQEMDQQDNENENEENPYDNQVEDDQQDEDNEIQQSPDDISEQISRSISPKMDYNKFRTKRQKGQMDDLLQLPLKKPRKDLKKLDQATQIIRKEEKERKRRQYIKKLMEAQEKATFDKILNERGRKCRQRQEKQMKQVKEKNKKVYRTLGDIPKIITKQNSEGMIIALHNTNLLNPETVRMPNPKPLELCQICSSEKGKYKTKFGRRFCSVSCFKEIESKENAYRMID